MSTDVIVHIPSTPHQQRRGRVRKQISFFFSLRYSSMKFIQIYPSKSVSYVGSCWTYKSWCVIVALVSFILVLAGLHIGWE